MSLSNLSKTTKLALIGGFIIFVIIYVYWLMSTGQFTGWVG